MSPEEKAQYDLIIYISAFIILTYSIKSTIIVCLVQNTTASLKIDMNIKPRKSMFNI